MDDEADRPYSRPPRVEDLVELCRALNLEGVRYLLIGGFAVILHGYVRGTKDIDLLVDPSPRNVQAIKRALAILPDNAAALLADDDLERYPVVRVADEVVIDLMRSACGIDLAQALTDGLEEFTLESVRIPVASKPLLIRLKDTVRPSDAADVQALRLRIEEEET